MKSLEPSHFQATAALEVGMPAPVHAAFDFLCFTPHPFSEAG